MNEVNKNIIEISVGEITPYEGSHKTDEVVGMIMQSLQDFGFQQPIVIDRNKVIVAGNALYKAAVNLGYDKVPCIVVDHLSEEQVNQYRIADNKTSEFATWNEKKLRQELSYLQSPQSMQQYFNTDIMRYLGLVEEKPKKEHKEEEHDDVIHKVAIPNKDELDSQFREQLRSIERNALVGSTEYVTYQCSNCGKTVKVRRS